MNISTWAEVIGIFARGTCNLLNDPGVRAMWRNEYLSFNAGFEEYIEARCKVPRRA